MIDQLIQAYNVHIRMDLQLRIMFYRIVLAQVNAGRSLLNCCQSLLQQKDLEPPVKELAQVGVEAAREGRLVTEGWSDARVLPRFDSRLLGHGELSDTVPESLTQLIRQSTESVSLTHDVLKPIWFQLLLLVIVVVMTIYSHLWVEVFVSDPNVLNQMLLWNVSLAFKTYCLPIVGVLVTWFLIVAFGRSRWGGSARKWLKPFDEDWRYQLGIHYCRIADLLHRNGASHIKVSRAFAGIHEHVSYVNRVIPPIQRDLRDGKHYADVLSERVLPSDQAELIKSLAPGESRDQFAQAFHVVGESMVALLKRRYQRWLNLTRVVVLAACAGLILVLIFGMYDTTTVMATVMTRY